MTTCCQITGSTCRGPDTLCHYTALPPVPCLALALFPSCVPALPLPPCPFKNDSCCHTLPSSFPCHLYLCLAVACNLPFLQDSCHHPGLVYFCLPVFKNSAQTIVCVVGQVVIVTYLLLCLLLHYHHYYARSLTRVRTHHEQPVYTGGTFCHDGNVVVSACAPVVLVVFLPSCLPPRVYYPGSGRHNAAATPTVPA